MDKNSANSKIKILFVCMGNICRSPSAEAVMNLYIKNAGLSEHVLCDSAGTLSYHAGESADSRMKQHASKRNINLTSISRRINSHDYEEFDYLIAMDNDNLQNMQRDCNDENAFTKIQKITAYCTNPDYDEVPDPYYGGSKGFENVLDILEDGCKGLLNHIRNEYKI